MRPSLCGRLARHPSLLKWPQCDAVMPGFEPDSVRQVMASASRSHPGVKKSSKSDRPSAHFEIDLPRGMVNPARFRHCCRKLQF